MTTKNETSQTTAQYAIQNVTRSFEGWTRFNLNNYCLVKPNEAGRKAFIKEWMLTMTREEAERCYESKLDKHGYMKLQLWTAFEYFGSAMFAGSGSLHANEFYLETERLENCG